MSMRPVLTVVVALLLADGAAHKSAAAGRFDTKLTPDQQILQALNRLTFGPRPGDVEEVRKVGLDKWIEMQLHPDQIPENPELDAKLKPLDSLHMTPGEIYQEYYQPQNQMMGMGMRINPHD
ncbi:MAG: DUF1800 family protein [Ignavibacteriota bacterium]